MEEWTVHFHIWPYSGCPRGANVRYLCEGERKIRGASDAAITFKASDFNDARRQAESVMRGIMLDERVWQCGIEAIVSPSVGRRLARSESPPVQEGEI